MRREHILSGKFSRARGSVHPPVSQSQWRPLRAQQMPSWGHLFTKSPASLLVFISSFSSECAGTNHPFRASGFFLVYQQECFLKNFEGRACCQKLENFLKYDRISSRHYQGRVQNKNKVGQFFKILENLWKWGVDDIYLKSQ